MKHILMILVAALSLTAGIRAQSETLPTLRGKEAVSRLKQSGQYNSLREAFRTARQASGQTDDSLAPEAIRQSEKLTASDGAAEDLFGYGVSISGDTIVAGSDVSDIGANIFQGAAYVFVRSGAS